MPRKVAHTRKYDFVDLLADVPPKKLSIREVDQVRRMLGRKPSPEFLAAYSSSLATFTLRRQKVSRSTAAAVKLRIGAVLRSVMDLQLRLRKLEATDTLLLLRTEQRRSSQDLPVMGLIGLEMRLKDVLPVLEEALRVLSEQPSQRRMPALAERALAASMRRILTKELGAEMIARKDDTFDRILRLAFKQSVGEIRKDVADLMRLALKFKPAKNLSEEDHNFLAGILSFAD